MLVSDPPAPNPNIIAWAREQSGYDIGRVAKRLQVKPEQVVGWESGAPPTVRQLMNLAAFLRRPLSLFFQEEPPKARPLAAEYRRLAGVIPGHESPEFRRNVREMLARRELAIDLLEELGHGTPAFGLGARLDEDPRAVGERLRARIGITDQAQAQWRDKWQAWREWRSAIEDIGVLVFMFPDVKLEEARGIALLRSALPVVAVNTKEIVESRAFTALHEIVHLMLANAHEESSALNEPRSPGEFAKLERFAESAASYALASEPAFEAAIGARSPLDVAGVQQLANRFKMTPLAAATRLRESNRISGAQYRAWRVAWNQHVAGMRRSSGFATPVSKSIGRGGAMIAQLVFEALDSNRLTMSEAARALNLRTEHFDKLRQRLVEGAGAETPDE